MTQLFTPEVAPSTTPLRRPSRCSGSKALLLFGGDARTSELRTAGKQVIGRTTHRLGKQVVGQTTHRFGKQVVGLLIGLGTQHRGTAYTLDVLCVTFLRVHVLIDFYRRPAHSPG